MFTELQKSNFAKNNFAKKMLEMTAIKLSNFGDPQCVIDFYNMSAEIKIDIISSIPERFLKKIPIVWAEQVIKEILQMELDDIEALFLKEKAIDFERDADEIAEYILNIKEYISTLNMLNLSVLDQYAKSAGIIQS